MNNNNLREGTTPFARMLLCLEAPPWYAIYRAAIGLLIPPALARLAGDDYSTGLFVLFLLSVLFLIRAIPAALRKMLPFSADVQKVWMDRRQIAKRYDSYQWRKLLWIGAGLSMSVVRTSQYHPSRAIISLIVLLSGAIGLMQWRTTVNKFDHARHSARAVGDLA